MLGMDVVPGSAVVPLAAENEGVIVEIVSLGVGREMLYAEATIAEDAAELGRFHE